ncbi:MAG: AI-2E family transporter [Nanobdellota archaeon]
MAGAVLIFIIALVVYVVSPYLTAIITAALLSYTIYPLYSKVDAKIKRPYLSALIISTSMVLIALLPFLALIQVTTEETQAAYSIAKERIEGNTLENFCDSSGTLVCLFSNVLGKLEAEENFKEFITNSYEGMSRYLLKLGSDFLVAIPNFVLNVFIVIFVTFYLLRDGKGLIQRIIKNVPIRKKYKGLVQQRFGEVMRGVLYGQLYVALIQGGIAAIGYFIFGINAAVFWGLVTALFALVPVLGTAIIWVPASLSLALRGLVESSTGLIWSGVGLFLYGGLLVATVDNFLRPKLISQQSHTHPVVVLIGVLGGIKAFGMIGILIGPLILSMGIAMVKMYVEVMAHASKS